MLYILNVYGAVRACWVARDVYQEHIAMRILRASVASRPPSVSHCMQTYFVFVQQLQQCKGNSAVPTNRQYSTHWSNALPG